MLPLSVGGQLSTLIKEKRNKMFCQKGAVFILSILNKDLSQYIFQVRYLQMKHPETL